MVHARWAALALILALACCGARSDPLNIAPNPGFEQGAAADGVPLGWWLWERDKGSVKCAVDDKVAHSGARSLRITAEKGADAVVVATKQPVAEGDTFEVSVWARTADFTPTAPDGRIAFSAGLIDSSGKFARLKRMGAKIAPGTWQKLQGNVTIPPEIASLAIEVGIQNGSGTVWFDDPEIVPKSAYAMRVAAGGSQIAPAPLDWPVEIINRGGDKRPVRLEVAFDGKTAASRDLELDGKSLQRVEIRIHPPEPGKHGVQISLADRASGAELARAAGDVRVLPAIELEPLVPTHFCIEDGTPTLEARVWNHIRPSQIDRIEVGLKRPDGTVLDAASVGGAESLWQDVVLSSAAAGLGDYTVNARLQAKDGKTYAVDQPWHVIHRSQARVTFNDAGFPVADGKPLFPLGIFNAGRYDLMKKTGFTVTHAWNRMKLAAKGERTNNQPAKDYLDETEKAGLKAIGFLHVAFMEREDWDGLRRRVRMLRNHPALLAWDQEEGVARGEIKIDRLQKLVKIVREEDPNHPFVLADAYALIDKVDRSRLFPENLMDAGMWWFYPIPLRKSGASALEGKEAGDGHTIRPPSFLRASSKPIWVGLQAYKGDAADSRLPTPAEYRCMAYLAVAAGAKGLLYYMGGSGWSIEGEKDPNRPWGYLHDLVPELASMIPVFMSPDAPCEVRIDPPDAPIRARLKLADGVYTLIAVSEFDDEVGATFSHPSLGSRPVEVLFESRSAASSNGKLADRFKGYGVHVYRWKATQ